MPESGSMGQIWVGDQRNNFFAGTDGIVLRGLVAVKISGSEYGSGFSRVWSDDLHVGGEAA